MGNKGLALIMVVGILAVIIAVGVTFAVNMRLEAQTAANFRDSVRAKYLAEAGVELAIAVLRNDIETNKKIQVLHGQVVPGSSDTPVDVSGLVDPSSAPDQIWLWNRWCEGFDWLFDEWAEWFIPYLWREQSEAHIFMFGPAWDESGDLLEDAELVDVDGDGVYDATWHYVEVPIKGYNPLDLPKGVLYGRYAVKVMDESRMININAVGKLDSSGNYDNAYNLAATPAEIDIVPLLKAVLPPPYNNDVKASQIAETIVKWRYGEWRGDTGVSPGNDGSVDGSGYEADGLDNDYDGVVDNPEEAGFEDPTEFDLILKILQGMICLSGTWRT